MVIQETLRLYPPAAFVIRAALEDITFKDIMISKGMNIQIPVPILQQQCDLWGPDAHKFNPERFAHGIVGACNVTPHQLKRKKKEKRKKKGSDCFGSHVLPT